MKSLLAFALSFLSLAGNSQTLVNFAEYFEDQTLRLDLYHTGDAEHEEFTPDKIYRQGVWAGNPGNCIQPFELGIYKVNVYDSATNILIFSKGYNSIFAEYQTIDPAIQGIKRTYHESVLIPAPRNTITLVIEKRDRYNHLSVIYRQYIDPADYHIITETYSRKNEVFIPAVVNGSPHTSIDLVILGEGYSADEFDLFKTDLKYYTNLFFTVEPYKSNAGKFNIHGIFGPSEESGTDEPQQGIYRNTRLNSSFNIFDIDRYCLAEDNKSIRDMAAIVPYDAILIMVNKDRYGGGGIYNWQTVFNTGSSWRDYVFLHEFGHAFAGLADEYFSSPVAYVDIFTPGIEPLEANITILADPDNVKWKQFLSPGIKVPTEWGKSTYDSLVNLITDINAERINNAINDFFKYHPLKDKVGVFEGANYMSTGMYRPTIMSLMHKFEEGSMSYDPVNEHAILTTIRYYTGE